MPHRDRVNGPGCALVSHSDHTLLRHIWFLVRLIMSNNVCSSAQASGAAFICVDVTPVMNVSWKKRRHHCASMSSGWRRDEGAGSDRTCGYFYSNSKTFHIMLSSKSLMICFMSKKDILYILFYVYMFI